MNRQEGIYCFDSSGFIDSWRRFYPPGVFPSLWEEFAEMMKNGRIIVPKEVEKEILNGNDDLKEWFKLNSSDCVKKYTPEQLEIVREIVGEYPKAADYNKIKEYHADPFVVALAKINKAIVVTYEGNNGDVQNPRIPFLCKNKDVECFNMISFFQKEKLSFTHGR